VGKVRLNATMTQNVVTYTVEVTTDNSDGKLLPYLTANVKFIVGDQQNVLIVPNAALRWTPESDQIVAKFRPAVAEASQKKKSDRGAKGLTRRGVVWIPQGDQVRPVFVTRGLSDGSRTVVINPDLKAGNEVVVGVIVPASQEEAAGGSPFTPKFFRKSDKKK
jgi:HlyD family secretion protein